MRIKKMDNKINVFDKINECDLVESIENTESNALKGRVLYFLIAVCEFAFLINKKSKASFYNLQKERDKLIATFYDFDDYNKKEKIRCFKAENKIKALFDDVEDRFKHVQELKDDFCAQFLSDSPLYKEMIIEKYIKPLIAFLLSEYQLNINIKL